VKIPKRERGITHAWHKPSSYYQCTTHLQAFPLEPRLQEGDVEEGGVGDAEPEQERVLYIQERVSVDRKKKGRREKGEGRRHTNG
jgi:hypothetical protein